MNCFFHPEEAATASCIDCGKGLCQSCTAKYQIAICDDCNRSRNAFDIGSAIGRVIPSIILFIVFFFIGFNFIAAPSGSGESISISDKIMIGIIFGWFGGGSVWGWFVTKKWFRPKTAYVVVSTGFTSALRMTAWTIKIAIRIILSFCIGFVAMPYEMVKLIISLLKAKKVSHVINTNKE